MSNALDQRRISVGVIGCGNIFPAYANGSTLFGKLDLKACADLNGDLACARAAEFHLAALSIDEILADPAIELIVNLTVPKVHASVSTAALRAGKHVYCEKPLAIDVREGEALVKLAAEKNLRLGCAPDTFLGGGLQTSRKLIDDGWIGKPLSGTAFMMASGPESWHPNPAFFYERGAGPMLDMGPYYITALVHLLGPISSVSSMTATARSERRATCKEHFGRMLPVEVPTHYSGSLLFENGAIVNLVISFDVKRHGHKPIEIYGSEGSLVVPDPNTFGGPISLFRPGADGWSEMPLAFEHAKPSRGIGAADMAYAIESGRSHRCEGALALHVLEVMQAFETSHADKCWKNIENRCVRPMAFPLGLPTGTLDS